MLKSLRFLVVLALVVWLGVMITLSFFVAPSLFANESGVVPDSQVAGDIIAPLLHKMHVVGWIAAPLACALLLAILRLCPLRSRAPVGFAVALLAAAWMVGLASGTVVTSKIREIRVELKEEFGGYHLAPKEDPRRATFGALHGLSMMLSMLNLVLGAGALFSVTQMIEPASGTEES